MKRKYDNPKVKIGDWVYFYDAFENYETKCKYKVIGIKSNDGIIVEVKNNIEDKLTIPGWMTNKRSERELYNLPLNIRAWNVDFWRKQKKMEIGVE